MSIINEISPQNRRYDELASLLKIQGKTTAVSIFQNRFLISVSGKVLREPTELKLNSWFSQIREILLVTKNLMIPQEQGMNIYEMIDRSFNIGVRKCKVIKGKIASFIESKLDAIEHDSKNVFIVESWSKWERETSNPDLKEFITDTIKSKIEELNENPEEINDTVRNLIDELKSILKNSGGKKVAFSQKILEKIKEYIGEETYNYLRQRFEALGLSVNNKDLQEEKRKAEDYLKKIIQSYNQEVSPGHEFPEGLKSALEDDNFEYIDIVERYRNGRFKKIHAEVKIMDFVIDKDLNSGKQYYIGVSQLNCEECYEVSKLLSMDSNINTYFLSRGIQETSYGLHKYDLPERFENLRSSLPKRVIRKDDNPVAPFQEDTPINIKKRGGLKIKDFSLVCRKLSFDDRKKRDLNSVTCEETLEELEQLEENSKFISDAINDSLEIEKIAKTIPEIHESLKARFSIVDGEKKETNIHLTFKNKEVVAKISTPTTEKTTRIAKGLLSTHDSAFKEGASKAFIKFQLISSIAHLAKSYARGSIAKDDIENTVETSYFSIDTIAREIPEPVCDAVKSGLTKLGRVIPNRIPSVAKGLNSLVKVGEFSGEVLSKSAPFIAAGFGAYHAYRAFEEGHVTLGIAEIASMLAWFTPYGLEVSIFEMFLEPLLTDEGLKEVIRESNRIMDSEHIPGNVRYQYGCAQGVCSSIASNTELWVLIKKPFEELGQSIDGAMQKWANHLMNFADTNVPSHSAKHLTHKKKIFIQVKDVSRFSKEEIAFLVKGDIGVVFNHNSNGIRILEQFAFDKNIPIVKVKTKDSIISVSKNTFSKMNLYIYQDRDDNSMLEDICKYVHYAEQIYDPRHEVKSLDIHNLKYSSFTTVNLLKLEKDLIDKLDWLCHSKINLDPEVPQIKFTNDSVVIRINGRDGRVDDEIFLKKNCDYILLKGKKGISGFVHTNQNDWYLQASPIKGYVKRIMDLSLAEKIKVIELDKKNDIDDLEMVVRDDVYFEIWKISTRSKIFQMAITSHMHITLKIGDMSAQFDADRGEDIKHRASKLKWHSQLKHKTFAENRPHKILSDEGGGIYTSENFGRYFITNSEQLSPSEFISKGVSGDTYVILNQNNVLHNKIVDEGGYNDFFIENDSKFTDIELGRQISFMQGYGSSVVINDDYTNIGMRKLGKSTIITTKEIIETFDVNDSSTTFETRCFDYFAQHLAYKGFCVVIKDERQNALDNADPLFSIHDKNGVMYNEKTDSWKKIKICPNNDFLCEGSDIDDLIVSNDNQQIIDGKGGVNYLKGSKIKVNSSDCGINIINFRGEEKELQLHIKRTDIIYSNLYGEDLFYKFNTESGCDSLSKISGGIGFFKEHDFWNLIVYQDGIIV